MFVSCLEVRHPRCVVELQEQVIGTYVYSQKHTPIHTPSTNTKRDLAPTPPHKLYPHSSVDIAYRKVLHVQPEDGQH